ncbi:MAG: flagellar basal body P-ring formation chaperone FlgA [Pseudomonadota bacterium]
MQNDKIPTPKPRPRPVSSIFRLLGVFVLTTHTALAEAPQSLKSIEESARQFLEAGPLRQEADDVTVEIQAPDPRLRLAACDLPLEAFSAPGARAYGRTSVGVRCAGSAPWTVYLRARVRLWQEVLVSRDTLSRGELLTADDVIRRRVDVSQTTGGFLHHPDQVTELELRRTVAPGVVLTRNMLKSPAVIQRGDEVVLLASVGNLSVRTAGTALSTGAIGDQVTVENRNSQRRVRGVVVQAGLIRVMTGTGEAATLTLAGR